MTPPLTLDQKTHRYFLGDRQLPGVTSVLEAAGIVDTTWFTDEGKLRGQAVHMACHFLDEGTLDWKTVYPAIGGYIRAYERFKLESGFVPKLIEHQVCSLVHGFAGTLDRFGWSGTRVWLPDLKTGDIEPWAGVQTAAYEIALREEEAEIEPFEIERFGLQLKKDGKYSLIPFNDPADKDVFLAALAIRNWKHNHGGLK